MSARKGYLLPSPKYTTIMACSDTPSGNAFLVDSLISGRSESAGGHYAGSALCVPPSPPTEVAYGLHNYGYFHGMAKRSDVAQQNMVSSPGAYMSSMEMWMDTQRSCRMDQEHPVGSQVAPCSFAQNIKEESTYCLYEQPKCPKASTAEDLTYSRLTSAGLGSTSCTVTNGGSDGSSVPVPGYFRLSQTHAHSHKLYNTNGPQPNPSPSRFGLHPAAPARFHTQTNPTPAPAQELRDTEDTGTSGKADLQPGNADVAEEARGCSEAEGSSAEEAEEHDDGAATGTKGKHSPACFFHKSVSGKMKRFSSMSGFNLLKICISPARIVYVLALRKGLLILCVKWQNQSKK